MSGHQPIGNEDGSIWIGTTEGLTQLSDVKYTIYSSTEGYAADAALTGEHLDEGKAATGLLDGHHL